MGLIPLRDDIPHRSPPVVNVTLIGTCSVVFLFQLLQGPLVQAFVVRRAFVPVRFFHPARFGASPATELATLVTSTFLHGGLLHLAGNMLYLWIFGDNVEDALGHVRYLVFYLACGASPRSSRERSRPASAVPIVGASGAIAGVLGAYFVLHPRARVVTLVPLFILFPLVEIPAGLYLLVWFLFQFWMGTRFDRAGPGARPGWRRLVGSHRRIPGGARPPLPPAPEAPPGGALLDPVR